MPEAPSSFAASPFCLPPTSSAPGRSPPGAGHFPHAGQALNLASSAPAYLFSSSLTLMNPPTKRKAAEPDEGMDSDGDGDAKMGGHNPQYEAASREKRARVFARGRVGKLQSAELSQSFSGSFGASTQFRRFPRKDSGADVEMDGMDMDLPTLPGEESSSSDDEGALVVLPSGPRSPGSCAYVKGCVGGRGWIM